MVVMARMTEIDVRRINLNLLPALEALLAEGAVGAAARRTHVSQSAMSHSLGRLRAIFGDPLLVGTGRHFVRTPLAERLATQLPRALDELGAAVAVPAPFDPSTSRRTFRIATFDYFELTVLPDLLAHLATHAPHVDLVIDRFARESLPALAAGDIDLALVGDSDAIPRAGLSRAKLPGDPFVVLARQGHPRLKKKLDLATYAALGHVLVSVEGRVDGVVDRALAKHGLARRVAVRVAHFASVALAVQRTDYISTIARPIALRAVDLGLRIHEPPLLLPAPGFVGLWSHRYDDDLASRWLRELLFSGVVRAPPRRRAARTA